MDSNTENKRKGFWKGWGSTLVFVLVFEIIEELLEEAFAFGLTWLFVKSLSAVTTFTIAQFTKVIIKKIIKDLTYKEGTDKMNKLKTFFKGIYANKKTIIGSLSGITATVSAVLAGTGVVSVSDLPALDIQGFNISPILFYGLLLIGVILGVFGKGAEKYTVFLERVTGIKQEKTEKNKNKLIKKEAKRVEKLIEAEKINVQKETELKRIAQLKAIEDAKKEEARLAEEQKNKVFLDIATNRVLESLKKDEKEK